MIVIGTFFAIVIAKQLYGGLGQNPFNPAMVGYVVLLISFPVQMTSWLPPDELRATALSLHDTLLAIFSGHTSQGATLHELQMGVDGISRHAARRFQNRPAQRPQCGTGIAAAAVRRRAGRHRLAVGQPRLRPAACLCWRAV